MSEKLYYAKDLTVWKSPVREEVEGGHRLTVGFPVCTVSDIVGEEGAAAVAELLVLGEASQNEAPRPPAARELLELIDRKAEAGLCYFTLGSARAFLEDIRDLVATHLAEPEKDSTVPEWIIERVENCVLDADVGEYAGLADHAAFEAGQDNAVANVATMLRAATKKDSTNV
jgi:hypothetical protein